jgi:hypothetical protein
VISDGQVLTAGDVTIQAFETPGHTMGTASFAFDARDGARTYRSAGNIIRKRALNTVARALKKNDLRPHLKEYWVIPPKANAGFVAAMGDVLEVYTRPHDPARPLVAWTRHQSNSSQKLEHRYLFGRGDRHDTTTHTSAASLFMLFAPLEGWRDVKVTERHAAIDYAQLLKELSDIHFVKAEKIVLVQDNLNTHVPASLYEAFTASNISAGSIWPNPSSPSCPASVLIGASPTSAASSARLLPGSSTATLTTSKLIGGFTAADARIKLKSLYPAL